MPWLFYKPKIVLNIYIYSLDPGDGSAGKGVCCPILMPCILILKLILRGRESELLVQVQPGMCNSTDTGIACLTEWKARPTLEVAL